MTRLRLGLWLASRPTSCPCLRQKRPAPPWVRSVRCYADVTFAQPIGSRLQQGALGVPPDPGPPPSRARRSAKLAAMLSRLSLPARIPPEALARALIDPTADGRSHVNNANLAYLGATLIHYHASEMLLCRYPRLPMVILYQAMDSYAGSSSLAHVARSWGVELIHHPGPEVDPGHLQYAPDAVMPSVATRWGYKRAEEIERRQWHVGVSSRVVLDDPFGKPAFAPGRAAAADPDLSASSALSLSPASPASPSPAYSSHTHADLTPMDALAADKAAVVRAEGRAYADFVRSVVGIVLLYCGRSEAKAFVRAHLLSRRVNVPALFSFSLPTRELAQLCRREGYEKPVARLISETGRASRTPVFVVGIFSGSDKIGEAAGPSLDFARVKACMQALRSWYLYSPLDRDRVPSDTHEPGAGRWKPVHIDMGEII